MVRVITQNAFDEVVRENMEFFEMTPEEAIDDAVKQMEAQGVDLSNIIKNFILTGSDGNHIIRQSIIKINQLIDEDVVNERHLIIELDRLQKECEHDIACKLMAANEGFYGTMLKCVGRGDLENMIDVLGKALEVLVVIMNGQPDLMKEDASEVMVSILDNHTNENVIIYTLKWIQVCCKMHECNRQQIFDSRILAHLKAMLEKPETAKIVRETCVVMRYLILDDDIRVEYGRAHHHAREMATQTLRTLTHLLSVFKTDQDVLNDLILTIASLIVRHEFCLIVEEAGGLQFVLDAMVEFHDKESINRQCFKLLKSLAGHDDVKRNIVRQGAATLICTALDTHKNSDILVVAGLRCIAAITLREVANSQAFFDAGVAEVITQCMNMHKRVMLVQRHACWAIRNMVSRCTEQRAKYIELGIEAILNDALKNFGKDNSDDIKLALRDLGCEVKLDEQWTGRGGLIQTSSSNGTEKH